MDGRVVYYGDDDLLHVGQLENIQRAETWSEDESFGTLEEEVVIAVMMPGVHHGALCSLGVLAVRRLRLLSPAAYTRQAGT